MSKALLIALLPVELLSAVLVDHPLALEALAGQLDAMAAQCVIGHQVPVTITNTVIDTLNLNAVAVS
jgi:hypothetical protein